jgi:hypothetical protein
MNPIVKNRKLAEKPKKLKYSTTKFYMDNELPWDFEQFFLTFINKNVRSKDLTSARE